MKLTKNYLIDGLLLKKGDVIQIDEIKVLELDKFLLKNNKKYVLLDCNTGESKYISESEAILEINNSSRINDSNGNTLDKDVALNKLNESKLRYFLH